VTAEKKLVVFQLDTSNRGIDICLALTCLLVRLRAVPFGRNTFTANELSLTSMVAESQP
jgi:hypothetical protein